MVVKNIASLGSGLMGRQIAMCAAKCGFNTTMYCRSDNSVAKVKAWIDEYLAGRVAKNKLTEGEAKKWLANLTIVTSMEEAVKDADLIIESLLEDEQAKREAITEANLYMKPECIFGTNSSAIPSSRFIDCMKDPSKLCNMHFFNPALVMKLVEIVINPETSQDTIDTVKEVSVKMEKVPVLVKKEIPGFIVSAMLGRIQEYAFQLVDGGYCTVEDVDLAMELGCNHPMGPFRLMDLTGIDLTTRGRYERWQKSQDPKDKPPQFLIDQYLSGNWGRKTGKGWYDYTNGK